MATLINGVAYQWSQIKVNIDGYTPSGVSALSYSDKQETQYNYGIGNSPVSKAKGKIESEATITLSMKELEFLQSQTPTGRLQDLKDFDVIVSYIPENGRIVTHTLHNCSFSENGRDVSTGDMSIDKEVGLNPSHISWK